MAKGYLVTQSLVWTYSIHDDKYNVNKKNLLLRSWCNTE